MMRLSFVLALSLLLVGCFSFHESPTPAPLPPAVVLEEKPEPKPSGAEISEVPPWTLPDILIDPAPDPVPVPKKTVTEEPLPLPPLPPPPNDNEEKTQAEEKPPADNLWTKQERKPSMYTFEILKTSGKQPYYWRVKASNGQILLTSEKYANSPVKTMEEFTKRMQPGTFKVKDLTNK